MKLVYGITIQTNLFRVMLMIFKVSLWFHEEVAHSSKISPNIYLTKFSELSSEIIPGGLQKTLHKLVQIFLFELLRKGVQRFLQQSLYWIYKQSSKGSFGICLQELHWKSFTSKISLNIYNFFHNFHKNNFVNILHGMLHKFH